MADNPLKTLHRNACVAMAIVDKRIRTLKTGVSDASSHSSLNKDPQFLAFIRGEKEKITCQRAVRNDLKNKIAALKQAIKEHNRCLNGGA